MAAPPIAATTGSGAFAAASTARPSAASTVVAPVSGPARPGTARIAPVYGSADATRATAMPAAGLAARVAGGTTGLRPAVSSFGPATTAASSGRVAPFGAVGRTQRRPTCVTRRLRTFRTAVVGTRCEVGIPRTASPVTPVATTAGPRTAEAAAPRAASITYAGGCPTMLVGVASPTVTRAAGVLAAACSTTKAPAMADLPGINQRRTTCLQDPDVGELAEAELRSGTQCS